MADFATVFNGSRSCSSLGQIHRYTRYICKQNNHDRVYRAVVRRPESCLPSGTICVFTVYRTSSLTRKTFSYAFDLSLCEAFFFRLLHCSVDSDRHYTRSPRAEAKDKARKARNPHKRFGFSGFRYGRKITLAPVTLFVE